MQNEKQINDLREIQQQINDVIKSIGGITDRVEESVLERMECVKGEISCAREQLVAGDIGGALGYMDNALGLCK